MKQAIRKKLQLIARLNDTEQLMNFFLSMVNDVERLESVLDSLAEGILVCDSEHNLIWANKFSERLLPLTRRGEEPAPVWNCVNDEDIAAFLKGTLLSADRVDGREFETEAKGVFRLLSISIFPLVKDHSITGSLVHVDDITEKRRKEARMRQAESLASLTTLAAGVAHEIKNPLGSISIHIQLLQKAFAKNEELYYFSHPEDKPDPNFSGGEKGPTAYFATFHRYIDVINEEMDRLNHIVVDFLFAVRPMTLNVQEANLNALIREIADFTDYELKDARVKLVLELEENLPLVDFDGQVMKQALLNLIQNAVAAMDGGGTLTIKTEWKDNDAVVSISDTGRGIPEENLAKIFEPYFTTKERGSGLGLTLVFKIIREHRGEITVASKEGEGTCFTIILPIPQRERRLLPCREESKCFAVSIPEAP
jgi:PAS domain S-box-containing protein